METKDFTLTPPPASRPRRRSSATGDQKSVVDAAAAAHRRNVSNVSNLSTPMDAFEPAPAAVRRNSHSQGEDSGYDSDDYQLDRDIKFAKELQKKKKPAKDLARDNSHRRVASHMVTVTPPFDAHAPATITRRFSSVEQSLDKQSVKRGKTVEKIPEHDDFDDLASRDVPRAKPPPPPGSPPAHARARTNTMPASLALPAGAVQAAAANNIQLVDALTPMQKGTAMLKYGKNGYPHFRQFEIVGNNRVLQWFSKRKKLGDTQIELDQVDELVLGQTTANFHRVKAPELTPCSFSLIYEGRRKTLDLVAKDPIEFQIWTQGLMQLIREVKRPDRDVSKLKALMVEVDTSGGVPSPRNGSLSPRRDDDPPAGAPTPSKIYDKASGEDLLKQFEAIKKRVAAKIEQLDSDVQLQYAKEYHDLRDKLQALRKSVNEVAELLTDGEFGLAEEELWSLQINYESFSAMLKAAKS